MVAKLTWRSPGFLTVKDTQWLCQRSRAVLHEFLSLTGVRAIPTSTLARRYVECLRLTLLIIMVGALYRILHLSREAMANRLRAALVKIIDICETFDGSDSILSEELIARDGQTDRYSIRQANEMLLWMCFIGYWAAGETDALWFAVSTVKIATNRLDLRSLRDLEEVMLRHLYSKTMQRDSLRKISSTILSSHEPYERVVPA